MISYAMYQSYFKTSSNYVLPDQFDEILHIDSTNKIEEVDISSKGTLGLSLWFHAKIGYLSAFVCSYLLYSFAHCLVANGRESSTSYCEQNKASVPHHQEQ